MGARRRRGMVHLLGLFTLLFFGGGGMLLILYQDRELLPLLIGEGDIWSQVLLGIASGISIGSFAWWIITWPFMKQLRMRYSSMIGPLIVRRSDRILISICAGVGEELFFRGALQFWLGIPFTAILFVAIHGYLDPRSWRISIYGSFMTLAMIIIGWMADRYGLLAPMLAHTLIDIVLLEHLHAEWRRQIDRDSSDIQS